MRRPRNQLTIRHDVLAILRLNLFNLSYHDFGKVKNMDTRPTLFKKRGSNTITLHDFKKWPARPDVFLKCPTVDQDVRTDDNMARYLRYEKYVDIYGSRRSCEKKLLIKFYVCLLVLII